MSYLSSKQPTASEIQMVARATVAALKQAGFSSCFVGSVACNAYGMSRVPNDIDIVVLTSVWTTEELKRRVVAVNPSFYLINAKSPRATYRVLWYRLGGYRRSCKVDILVPGVMNIPSVPDNKIVLSDDYTSLPLMPFIPLLLLKLQAWSDHGEDCRSWVHAKQSVDVRDIIEMLNIAAMKHRGVSVKSAELKWLPQSFVEAGEKRVKRFVAEHTYTARHWKTIGY